MFRLKFWRVFPLKTSSFVLCLMPGDYGGGDIPVPIPNTEVKPSNADDTASLSRGKVGRRQAFFY